MVEPSLAIAEVLGRRIRLTGLLKENPAICRVFPLLRPVLPSGDHRGRLYVRPKQTTRTAVIAQAITSIQLCRTESLPVNI